MSAELAELPELPDTMRLEFSGCRAGAGPLVWAQKGMWNNIRAIAPHDQHLNVSLSLATPDGPSVERVVRALRTLVGRHDALRTTFPADATGEPWQAVAGEGAVPVTVTSGPDAKGRLTDALAARRFDPATDLPIRVGLAVTGDRVTNVVLCLSHLVVDGWSCQLLQDELAELLAGADELPPVTRQPIEQARYERDVLAPRLGHRVAEYWRDVLSSCPAVDTFAPRAAPAQPRFWHGSYRSYASQYASRILAAEYRVSETSVFLAGVARVLTAYADRDAVPVLLRVTNRFSPEVQRSVMYLCQNIPVLLADGRAEFPRLVSSVHRTALRAYRYSQYDPDAIATLRDDLHRTGSRPADLTATVNLATRGPDADGQPEPARPARLRELLRYSSFTWRRRFDNERLRLFVSVFGGMSYQVIGDTRYFPPDQLEGTVRSIEATLLDEADRVTGAP